MTGPPRAADHSPEELLRKLNLAITRRLDGILQGEYQALFPGPGSEPGDARPYAPGDDVRHIDWNVTARTTVPHVRVPIADRELEVWVVVDLSASLDFGTAHCEKRDLAISAVAAVGFLTARVGNRIGALLIQQGVLARIPPRPGRNHLLGLLHGVATAPRAEGGGDAHLPDALREVARIARRRGMVVVVSDFLSEGDWLRPLRALARRHDVMAVEVVDPRELELPDVGYITLVDPETGRSREVQTASRKLRARYAEAAAAQRAEISRRMRAAGADHLILRTDGDWLLDLVRFVVNRKRPRERAAARQGAPVS